MEFLLNNKLVSGLLIGTVTYVVLKMITSAFKTEKPKEKKIESVITPKEYRPFKLIMKKQLTQGEQVVSPVMLYRFGIDGNRPLGLPTGQHIAIRAKVEGEEEPIVRYYTPTSSNDDLGHFDLVIKVYPKGKMSKHIDNLKIGESIEVAGPKGEFVYEANKFKKIGMLAGGTGITPMLQIIREIVKHSDTDKTEVSLLNGNLTVQDIILREDIDNLASKYPQFQVYHVLNEAPANWTQGVGYITREMIQQRLPAPADDIKILLCGPPPMLKAMREHLTALGYEKKHIFGF